MVDSSVIYNVVVNFQYKSGEKAAKVSDAINRQAIKTGKIFTGLNKLFQQNAMRMFSLIFLMRRMRDGIVNMLKPAADMVGITDVWNMTLGLFFLPIMEALLPLFLQFADIIIGMPDGIKLLVGAFALVSLALLTLGTLLIGAAIGFSALKTAGIAAAVGINGAFAIGIIGAIIALLFWLYTVKNEMGGWIPFFTNILKGVTRIFILLGAVIAGAFNAAWDLIKSGWNKFVDYFVEKLNVVIGWINAAINAFNKVNPFADIPKLPTVSGSSAHLPTVGIGQAFDNAYGSIVSDYIDWETTTFGADPNQTAKDINNPQTAVVVNQTNTFNVADWQKYQTEMSKMQRQMEQDLKRQLAAGQA